MKTNQREKNIPLGWQQVKLADVVSFLDNKRIPIESDERSMRKGIYPYYGASGIIDYINDYIFDGEFILLGEDGANIIDRSSRLAFLVKGKIWVNNHAHVFQARESIRAYFLSEYLESLNYEKFNTGSAQPKLNRSVCEKIPVLLPPLPEQNRIVSVLETWDKTIEKLAQKIEVKKQIKKGLMQDLLTGKKRLSGFSDKWELVKLGKIATFKKGKGLPKSELNSNGEYEAIHYGELFTKYNEYIETVKNRTNSNKGMFMSKKNDILMPTSDVTPRGLSTASYINKDGVVLGGDILVIRSNGSLNGLFFCYLVNLNKKDVIKLVSGSTVFHLYGSDMAKFELKLPPIKEQESIVKILLTSDKEITELEKKLSIIKDQKKYLLNNLITGTIRTPETLSANLT